MGLASGRVVGTTGGDVVPGSGSGGGWPLSVGRGLGEVASSTGGTEDVGRSSWTGGAVGGGPEKEEVRNCLVRPPTTNKSLELTSAPVATVTLSGSDLCLGPASPPPPRAP